MSFVGLLVDGESNGESEQSNNERFFSIESELETLLRPVNGVMQPDRLIVPFCILRMLPHVLYRTSSGLFILVREETAFTTEMLRTSSNRNASNEILTSGPQILKLQFMNKIPFVILTGKKIKSEDSAPIVIALVDGLTGQVIKSGPVASARVEIVVLAADFGCTEGDHWTVGEFESKIIKEMSGRKSILLGNELNLNEGTGFVSNLSFTHNSNWVRICQLRLGAKVVGDFDGIKVKEAKTEPFFLKDSRAIYRDKHESPSPNDEVWRLKQIRKNGPFHKRLIEANIKTVHDFLVHLSMDPQRLKQMHNGGDKKWEVIVGHASKCMTVKKDVVSNGDESDLIKDSSNLITDNEPSNSTRLETPSGNHLPTTNHDNVANTSSPLYFSPNNSLQEKVWDAVDIRKKWKECFNHNLHILW